VAANVVERERAAPQKLEDVPFQLISAVVAAYPKYFLGVRHMMTGSILFQVHNLVNENL
jgi:hypothetical protein